MLSNNVWSINEERVKRQKRTRKGVRSRGHFARLIQPREIRKNFNFCSDSLALSRKPLRIILYPPPPPPSPPSPLHRALSLSLSVSFSFPLFLKDIFNKESRLRSRLIRWFSRETDTYSIGRLWRSLFDTPSYFFPPFFSHNSFYPLHAAVGTFTVYPPLHLPILLSSRKREKERNQLLLFQRANDADRDLKAAFSAEEKRLDCLKRIRRKTHRSRSFSYFEERWRSFLRLRVDATATGMHSWRREKGKVLITRRRALEKHIYPLNSEGEIPAFISLLDIYVSRPSTHVLSKILDVRQLYVVLFVQSFKKLH